MTTLGDILIPFGMLWLFAGAIACGICGLVGILSPILAIIGFVVLFHSTILLGMWGLSS